MGADVSGTTANEDVHKGFLHAKSAPILAVQGTLIAPCVAPLFRGKDGFMGTLQQHFELERPASAVYDAFSRPDAILKSLPGVVAITRVNDDAYRMTTGSPEAPREIELVISSRTPLRRIEWRTGDGAWSGSVDLETLGPSRTAVTISGETTSHGSAETPSATILHDGLQALKRALQTSHVHVSSMSGGAGERESMARRYAAEWRDTAKSALSKPTEFPFAVMRTISRQMDRVWGDVLRNTPIPRLPTPLSNVMPGLGWNPNVQVCEQDEQVRICIDVPGVDEAHLAVEIEDASLTVTGERQDERGSEGGQHRSEVRYGSFTRRIPLPDGIDADQARAVLRNGVLEVRIPMHRRPRRRVPIQQVT